MNAIQRHPLFSAWIALCALLVAGGVWWLLHLRNHTRHELAGLARKIQQRERLVEQARLPDQVSHDPETEPGDEAASALPDETVPRKPIDALIEIAGVKEGLGRLAAHHEVALIPHEAFGFSAYAHEGPAEGQLRPVHFQLALTRLVLEKLFAAHPEKLLGVQREFVQPEGGDRRGGGADDFFTLDARFDPRVPGQVEGRAIKVAFAGQTPVLRGFLNSLAGTAQPLLVRSVEVEAIPNDSSMKFSVVVLAAEPMSPGEKSLVWAEQSTLSPVAWSAQATQRVGGGSDGELFAPHARNRGATPAAAKRAVIEGLELLAVKREPFRLQLIGYFGAAGEYTAAFISPGLPATLLAREGHRFDQLGLVLETFAVRKSARGADSAPEWTACAELFDELAQGRVTLFGNERLLTDNPLAVLRLGRAPSPPRELRVGDSFQDGAGMCRIERIQFDPAEVEIVRRSSDTTQGERLLLRPPVHATTVQILPDSTDALTNQDGARIESIPHAR